MPCNNTPYSLLNTLQKVKPCLNIQYSIPNTIIKAFITGFLLIGYSSINAQTLPVGTPVLEDYYRRLQLLGQLDSTISFTVRPLTSEALNVEDVFNPDTAGKHENRSSGIRSFAKGKAKFQILPIALQTQYNSTRPYGWNDGPIIPARGFQTLLSAGVYAKYGILSIQLRPEFVYADNKAFSQSNENFPGLPRANIDLPQQFGGKLYSKIFSGQSSIRITYGALSLGLSSENLWWGPGIRNSLLMSNTSPGFKHLTLNTVKPIRTSIGSFEGQILGGRLEGSGFTEKPKDWRYLSGMTLSYQPRWIPGLFFGLTRSLQLYSKDINGIADYIPIFKSLNSKSNEEGNVPSDQLFSIYTRWLWQEAISEVYFEYSRGDHAANIRDYTLEPEHSRFYLFGFQKLLKLKNKESDYIQVNIEATHLVQSVSSLIRSANTAYVHTRIKHGYTHQGQIIGAGIGPGSNLQSIQVKWLRNFSSLGMSAERYVFNNDYDPSFPQRVNIKELVIGLYASKAYKKLLFHCIIQSLNGRGQLSPSSPIIFKPENFNFYMRIGITYEF